ncbi:hypothetical protein T439DRAFT_317940 [Meredithblackwellia eburnea MCA 4105]
MSETYAFIGLGLMGYHMAANLRSKLPSTASLYIYDINTPILEKFKTEHEQDGPIFIASSSREAAENASTIISIVPEGSHVRSVFLDKANGVLAAPSLKSSSKLIIDCSTIDIETSSEVAKALANISPSTFFCDAPVSGGPAGAEKGTLTMIIGASEDDENYQKVVGVLGKMGTNLFACGGPTLGLVTKLSNNYLSGLIAIATSEAMNMGMRHGLDPKVLSDVFKTSTAGSWVNANCNPVPGVTPEAPPSNGYKGGFKVQLMKKDFKLAVEAAHNVGAKLVLGDAGLATYEAAANDPRCRDLDSRVVYRWLGGKE